MKDDDIWDKQRIKELIEGIKAQERIAIAKEIFEKIDKINNHWSVYSNPSKFEEYEKIKLSYNTPSK